MTRTKITALTVALTGVMAFATAQPAFAVERTPKEKAELFQKFDTNKDGFVDRDEFASEMINIFISVDKDGSEFIEASELTDPDPKEFGDNDGNKDGKLSFDEVMSEKLGDFKKVDANGDRKLSLPEVLEYKK